MGNNKTVIPGENGFDPYSRNSVQGGNPVHGTIVPGMNKVAMGASVGNRNDERRNDPVVGFLYSVSRQGIGEYWPVYVGTNTIGRDFDNDVCLREGTVSGHHAVLNVKRLKTTNKVIASVRDIGSKQGIFLNDEELGYDPTTCKNEDIITVGDNYKLLLIIIDTESYGLSVAEDFHAVDDDEDADIPSILGNDSPYNHNNRPIDGGTIGINGESSGFDTGHTRFVTQ